MPLIEYVSKRFAAGTLAIIQHAVEIIEEYAAAGYDLTLRQLYYQFVARDLIPNKQSEYKRLGSIVNDARLAGLVDWRSIVDRTRNVRRQPHWDDGADIIKASAGQFQVDKWANQGFRPEVWIEKDALLGVIAGVCDKLDVPYFSCRGYVSQSEMWGAAQRHGFNSEAGQHTVVIHLGDHDPSGIDMTRDIQDRLRLFGAETEVIRIALNMDQVVAYGPPPNPAKLTDSRATDYVRTYGSDSWELDALEPTVMGTLITDTVRGFIDSAQWDKDAQVERAERDTLKAVAENWKRVCSFVDNGTV